MDTEILTNLSAYSAKSTFWIHMLRWICPNEKKRNKKLYIKGKIYLNKDRKYHDLFNIHTKFIVKSTKLVQFSL